ncbi:hypothetical protein OG21DRAFT_1093223 [Imleria badia]|nr:hypothetical protein OG21DRAFT_1093223 [Imleria badia]
MKQGMASNHAMHRPMRFIPVIWGMVSCYHILFAEGDVRRCFLQSISWLLNVETLGSRVFGQTERDRTKEPLALRDFHALTLLIHGLGRDHSHKIQSAVSISDVTSTGIGFTRHDMRRPKWPKRCHHSEDRHADVSWPPTVRRIGNIEFPRYARPDGGCDCSHVLHRHASNDASEPRSAKSTAERHSRRANTKERNKRAE